MVICGRMPARRSAEYSAEALSSFQLANHTSLCGGMTEKLISLTDWSSVFMCHKILLLTRRKNELSVLNDTTFPDLGLIRSHRQSFSVKKQLHLHNISLMSGFAEGLGVASSIITLIGFAGKLLDLLDDIRKCGA